MNTRPRGSGAAVVVAFLFVSLVMGLLAAALDPRWLVAGVAGALAVCLVFYDYRAGVVCLTILLPWAFSPALPQTRGFNVINFLVFASFASFAFRKAFGLRAAPVVMPPRVVRWCYLMTIAIAAAVAWPHLAQGSANYPPASTGLVDMYAPAQFVTGKLVKPLFFVLYAVIAANAIRDSKRPTLFLIPFGLSAVIAAVCVIIAIAMGWNVVARTQIPGLGLQVNEYGMLLSLAVGPLLFIAVGHGSRLARLASGMAFCVVSAGLLLTASRGAAVALAVVIAVWLIKRRRITDLILLVLLAAAAVMLMPEGVHERLTMGFDNTGATTARNMADPLTQGRVASWALLAPDILRSPVWGQGVGSVAWNTAVTAGRYHATHPHNMYLEILLDLGIAGFVAILYRYARTFRVLSEQTSLPPVVRDFFLGAFASFLGMLMFGATNGHYMPHPEQTFLWFSLAFAYAYWQLANAPTAATVAKPIRTFGVRPLAARKGMVKPWM
jgi:O-antigen ligase